MAMAIETGEYLLPEDVMIEILSWLPVGTLLQFKCVCKSWYAIITSDDFVSKHLNNYYNNINDGCLIAYQWYPKFIGFFPDETLVDLSHEVFDLPIPRSDIYGPCNGIYYLNHGDSSGLWNPATKEFKALPPMIHLSNVPPNLEPLESFTGFGLDPSSNDFKVVVIEMLYDLERSDTYSSIRVVLYTLQADSWKICGYLPEDYDLRTNRNNTYINGFCYWLGSYNRCDEDELILSFNMATDVFQGIKMPDYERPAFKSLTSYYGSIALFTVHERERTLDIWVLNEGFWTKQLSIATPSGLRYSPVGYWKSGKIFLESFFTKLILCDPMTQEYRELIELQAKGMHCTVVVYKESLVSIKGCSGHGR